MLQRGSCHIVRHFLPLEVSTDNGSFSEGATECSDRDPYLLRRINPPFRTRKTTFQSIAKALSLPMRFHLDMYVDGATMFMDMGRLLCEDENEIQSNLTQAIHNMKHYG